MHNLHDKVKQMLLILLSIMVNWQIALLAPQPTAFHTKCMLSELGNALNRCHFKSSFITFYCYHIHCTHRMPTPHTGCYSSKQKLKQVDLQKNEGIYGSRI